MQKDWVAVWNVNTDQSDRRIATAWLRRMAPHKPTVGKRVDRVDTTSREPVGYPARHRMRVGRNEETVVTHRTAKSGWDTHRRTAAATLKNVRVSRKSPTGAGRTTDAYERRNDVSLAGCFYKVVVTRTRRERRSNAKLRTEIAPRTKSPRHRLKLSWLRRTIKSMDTGGRYRTDKSNVGSEDAIVAARCKRTTSLLFYKQEWL